MIVVNLINLSKNGNRRGQRQLFELFHAQMTFRCRRYVTNREDAEECLSEGFCKIFEHLGGYTYVSDKSFVAWMNAIMVNVCLKQLRKKNTFLFLTECEATEIALEETVFADLSTTEIYKLIEELPVGYRTVFNLHCIDGYAHTEISSLLKISEGTSKSQLSRAKILLQKRLTLNQDFNGQQQSK